MARDGQPNPAGGAPPSRNQPNDKGPKPGDAAGNPGANPDKATGATMANQETGKPEMLGGQVFTLGPGAYYAPAEVFRDGFGCRVYEGGGFHIQ